MKCEICKTEMASDAPIYRVTRSWALNNPGVIRLCETCCSTWPSRDYPLMTKFGRKWYAPKPCMGCGRPVIMCTRRKQPKLFCCSIECDAIARSAIAREKRRHKKRKCECGNAFIPKRADSMYCSAACKQRAYRQRKPPNAEERAR